MKARTSSSHSCPPRALVAKAHRGATMVSVMLVSVSMLTVATLALRASHRDSHRAKVGVAREQALMAAHASVELAAAHYRRRLFHPQNPNEEALSAALVGSNPATDARWCTRDMSKGAPDSDCIPGVGQGSPRTGQRNSTLNPGHSDCAGRPCMRPGAIAMLPEAGDSTPVAWSAIPLDAVITGGDPQAVVTVWIRNNSSEALGAGGTGSWVVDKDKRVVLTGMARVRNSTVTIEQEYYFLPRDGATSQSPPTPDEGYGGGHNGDNAAVAVCKEDYAQTKPEGE